MSLPFWAAILLLALEYISLGVAFDSEPLGARSDGWAAAGSLGWLAVLMVAALMGTAVAVSAHRVNLSEVLRPRPLGPRSAALLLAHAAAVAALWLLSRAIFAESGPPEGSPAVWLSLWGLVAVATVVFLVAAAMPAGHTVSFVRSTWPALLAGAGIGVGAWVAGLASAFLWWPFGPMTLRATSAVLHAVLPGAVFDPDRALIGSERFQVIVAPVCSGFEGVGLMTVFVVSYMVLARRDLRFPRAAWLLPLGIAAAWLANVVRLVALVLVGTFASAEVAEGGFHARAGWVLFCGIALSLVLLVNRSGFFSRESGRASLDTPTAAYLVPFLSMVATALVTGLATTGVEDLYAARLILPVLALAAMRHHYRDIAWSFSPGFVLAGAVAGLAFAALAPRPDPADAAGWQAEWHSMSTAGQAIWLAVRAVGSILVVPVVEELAFRGYLLRRLVAREFEKVPTEYLSLPALLLSSAAFGAIHHGWWGGTLAGLVFGLVQIRGGVGQAIIAHVASNAVIAVLVLWFGCWWLWA